MAATRELEYGSENADGMAALMRAGTTEASLSASSSNSSGTVKNRFVALGLALCVTGAVVGYRAVAGDARFTTATAEVTSASGTDGIAVPTMELASQALSMSDMLVAKWDIMLLSEPNTSLCVDDGGGTTAGRTPFHIVQCDPNNYNQVFQYDPASSQIKSSTKVNLCMETSGPGSDIKFMGCDPKSSKQKFTFDGATLAFQNTAKKGAPQCLTGRGGTTPGARLTTAACNAADKNQKFKVESYSTLRAFSSQGRGGDYRA